MTEDGKFSRAARHEKRRNNKRKFLFFASLAVVFFIMLFSFIAFGNKETDRNRIAKHDGNPKTEIKKTSNGNKDDHLEQMEPGDEVEVVGNVKEVEIKEVKSTDQNVLKAFEGDWEPVGTKQQGPHTTNYDEGSADRIEIKRAVSIATGVKEDDMTEHWIGHGGDQKVIATIQDTTNDDYYRVYVTWIDEEGWQVTKVEKIKEFNSATKAEGDREEG